MNVVTTILFDGQFWIALVEKIAADGSISVGKFIFGPEPTNNDLLDFYHSKLALVQCHKSEQPVRIKKKRSIKEEHRITSKSREIFKELQSAYSHEKRKLDTTERQRGKTEKYSNRKMKKKEKHKGR
jgi:hypothetical protein